MMKLRLLVLIFCLALTASASAQSSDTLIWSLVGGDISTLNLSLIHI